MQVGNLRAELCKAFLDESGTVVKVEIIERAGKKTIHVSPGQLVPLPEQHKTADDRREELDQVEPSSGKVAAVAKRQQEQLIPPEKTRRIMGELVAVPIPLHQLYGGMTIDQVIGTGGFRYAVDELRKAGVYNAVEMCLIHSATRALQVLRWARRVAVIQQFSEQRVRSLSDLTSKILWRGRPERRPESKNEQRTGIFNS